VVGLRLNIDIVPSGPVWLDQVYFRRFPAAPSSFSVEKDIDGNGFLL
jgi:hypothetical protein